MIHVCYGIHILPACLCCPLSAPTPTRIHAGHWEDPLNLDSALAEFVMGHWVALEGGGPEEEEDEEQGASAGAPAAAGSVETVSVVQGGGKQGSGAQQQRKRPKAAQPLKYWYNQVGGWVGGGGQGWGAGGG
jgi:hypothetical protein